MIVFFSFFTENVCVNGCRSHTCCVATYWGDGGNRAASSHLFSIIVGQWKGRFSAEKTPNKCRKDGRFLEERRQKNETKPMESLNNINGIVERNQWNC